MPKVRPARFANTFRGLIDERLNHSKIGHVIMNTLIPVNHHAISRYE